MNPIGLAPSEIINQPRPVPLVAGAIVCCHVFGVIEHSGIYVGDDCIVELQGTGLIRPISMARFLQGRTGEYIFVATNSIGQILVEPRAIDAAIAAIYHYRHYHLLNDNCHRFVWYCLSGQQRRVIDFDELNLLLAQRFGHAIEWRRMDTSAAS
ncbi:hypothetical protein [Shewanella sp. NIFS-20-20]|uniref:hypothetical protein n=1 Tax=Shewanella sp. NIFS-20-20 TaxID=2853806 RepID=UPI001C485672|nr:hypothetical protein [Shewanella sp. NIFS-20-20]MBV7315523.1 hypothetical protein [Shewanella sp. NIFS-20-20]